MSNLGKTIETSGPSTIASSHAENLSRKGGDDLMGSLASIDSPTNLRNSLLKLDEAQRTTLVNALGEKLKQIIPDTCTRYELNCLFEMINEKGCAVLINALGDKINKIIPNTGRLISVLRDLGVTKCRAILAALGDERLKTIIIDAVQLGDVLRGLDVRQCQALLAALGERIKEIISHPDHLHNVLPIFDEQKCKAVLDALGDRLQQIVFHDIDFLYQKFGDIPRKLILKILFSNSILRKGFLLSPATFPKIAASSRLASYKQIAKACGITLPDIRKHIGKGGKFLQKQLLHDYLTQLTRILENPSLSLEDKNAIKVKIAEGAGSCTDGFMNRVNDCLADLSQAKTMSQLIAMYRRELVEKVTYAALSEHNYQSVHGRQLFFEVANSMGLNIPVVAPKDSYSVSDAEGNIEARLDWIFVKEFTPSRIVGNLFRTSFARLGYVGRREAGKDYSKPGLDRVILKILGFLKNALKKTDADQQVDKQDYHRFLECLIEEGDYDDDDFDDINAILDINWQRVISDTIERLFLLEEEGSYVASVAASPSVGLVFAREVELIPNKLRLKLNSGNTRDSLFIASKVKEPANPKSPKIELYFFAGNVQHFSDCINEEAIKALEESTNLSDEEKSELIDSFVYGGIDLSLGNLAKKITQGIDTAGKLCDLLHRLNETQRRAAVSILGGEALSKLAIDAKKLRFVLFYLDDMESRAVLDALGERLNEIISNKDQLISVLLPGLNAVKCKAVLDAWGDDKLNKMICDEDWVFSGLLDKFDRKQCKPVLIALNNTRLKKMIGSSSSRLNSVLRSFNEMECRAFLDSFEQHELNRIISNGNNLASLVSQLNQKQGGAVLSHLGRDRVKSLLLLCKNGQLDQYRSSFINAYIGLRSSDTRNVFARGLFSCFQATRQGKINLAKSMLRKQNQRDHNGLLGLIDRKTRG